MTPSDLLREYAALLEDSGLTTMTVSGQQLDDNLTTFLAGVADEDADETEAIYDLFLVVARAFFAIHMAHHDGEVDRSVINEHMMEFGRAVAREHAAFDLNRRKDTH